MVFGMAEPVNEAVSVTLWSNHRTKKTVPYSLYWNGRRYHITTIGLHHTVWEGRRLFHIFSVSDGSNFFKLLMDSETLGWKLIEIDSLSS